MGMAKHLLRFGDQTAIERIVQTVSRLVDQIVLVKSAEQQICAEDFAANVSVVSDPAKNQGPLLGLVTGWDVLPGSTEHAFVVGCDLPLVSIAVTQRLLDARSGWEGVVPVDAVRSHPLCSVYSRHAARIGRYLLGQGRRSMHEFVDRLKLRRISVERFRDVDPGLYSFRNLNTPADYEAVLRLWEIDAP